MKFTSSVWLSATLLLVGSQSALAQQHTHAVVSSDCEQCRNGVACEEPGCCLSRVRLYPDTGWNPPVNMPVNYNWAWYGLSAPQAPYGAPGGGFIAQHPSVYQPTDTTQLGYYYHKVPTWQPQPGRVPGAPNPAMFHSRICPNNCYGAPCYGAYGHGAVMHSYAVPTLPQTMQTVSSAGQAAEATPVTAPAPLKSVRPVSSNPEPQLQKAVKPSKKPLLSAKPVSGPTSTAEERPAVVAPEPAPKASSESASEASATPSTKAPTKPAQRPSAMSAAKASAKPATKRSAPSLLKSLFD